MKIFNNKKSKFIFLISIFIGIVLFGITFIILFNNNNKFIKKVIKKITPKKKIEAIYASSYKYFYTILRKDTDINDNKDHSKSMIIYNDKNEILYEYPSHNTEDYILINDKVSKKNIYYVIYKTNHTLSWYDNEYEKEEDIVSINIYDAHNKELIIEENEYNLNKYIPTCAFGKYLIYDIKTEEITNYGAIKSKIYIYDTEKKQASLLIDESAYKSIECKAINDYYFISLDCYVSPENTKLKENNYDYYRIQNTNMYDTNFNHIYKFHYIVDNIGIVNNVEFFITYHYEFWGNAFKKEDMLKLYQMYRKFDCYKGYIEIFDDTIINIKHIGKEIFEVNDKGRRFLYNANNDRYVYDLDNNAEYNEYKTSFVLFYETDLYLFEDGAIVEGNYYNSKISIFDIEKNYKLIDENNNDLNIISDKPIIQNTLRSKKTKNSLIIKEKITDENNNARYLVRTLDKNIFSGIYEDEIKEITILGHTANVDKRDVRLVCFTKNDNTNLIVDILTGDKYETDNVDNIGFVTIKDNIYLIKFENGKQKLNFYKFSDPNKKLYFAENDNRYYCTNIGDVLILTLVRFDDNGYQYCANTVFDEDFDIVKEFYGDFNWNSVYCTYDKCYYRIHMTETDEVIYYDKNFNEVTDQDLVKGLEAIYNIQYK